MEAYKRDLCQCHFECDLESEILEKLENNQGFHAYTFNLNSDGRLHSEYKDGYYEPAIIYKNNGHINMYWLFNGEILDCEHPFHIVARGGVICRVEYFSTNRIQNNKPIVIYTFKCQYMGNYNIGLSDNKILDEYECTTQPTGLDFMLTLNNRMLFDNMMI